MHSVQSSNIIGLVPDVPGILYGQNERTDELNSRLTERQFSDRPLQPNYDPRPVPTKYSLFPITNRRKLMDEPLSPYLDHSVESNFAPITQNGPVDGYLQNVNTESSLRNQYFALQKGVDQSVYVPSSTSDLYNVSVVSRPSIQPHQDLFNKPTFESRVHPNVMNPSIGNNLFSNHTRTQLRGSGTF